MCILLGMMKKLYIYVLLLFVIMLSSCVMSRKINYLQEGNCVPLYNDSVSFDDYQLQRGDYIYTRVNAIDKEMADMFNGSIASNNISFMTPDNSTARLYLYLVEEDDCIDYPYVGRLNVVGKTLREVKLLLEENLDSMLHGFSVDVRLANRSFSIIGESGTGRGKHPDRTGFCQLHLDPHRLRHHQSQRPRCLRLRGNNRITPGFYRNKYPRKPEGFRGLFFTGLPP